MLLLVSGSTRTVARLASGNQYLGHLLTPNNGNAIGSILKTGLLWALDNGAFSGWNPASFRRRLRNVAGQPRCLFVVAPDVVGDAMATCKRFSEWQEEVAATELPVAFVGQDGVEDIAERIPWGQFRAWFVGGSTSWKLSRASEELCREAHQRGKWVHMGRVNSFRRLTMAYDFGCDSVDGSSMSMYGDRYIDSFSRWIAGLRGQPRLFN